MTAKRIDANQQEIVKALRQIGCTVLILSDVGKGCADILCGIRDKNYLFEIKDGKKPPSQRKLTPAEQKFHDEWKGQLTVINSIDDAIKVINCFT